MKQCGGNQWWSDGAKLVIRRQRRSVDILKGLCALAGSAGLAWFMRSDLGLQGAFYVLVGVCYGLSSALGTWEVTLHRVSGRGSWRWGLGVPLYSWSKEVTDTDRVQLVTSKGTTSNWRTNAYSVHLTGEDLAGSDDYDEALELAEAVAHHMRLGLQVDDGRVLAGPTEPPTESLSPPPPGCRVQVRAVGEQRVVELPAPGWVGSYRLQAGVCSVLMLVPVGLAGYLHSRHLSWQTIAMLSPLLLLPGVFSGYFLRGIWAGVHTSWSITVSRWGLDMASAGPRQQPPTRLAAQLIRDIDVREQEGGTLRVSDSTCPMLVIERQDGKTIAFGEGLPREELEWAAARVRQELAALTGDRRQQGLKAG